MGKKRVKRSQPTELELVKLLRRKAQHFLHSKGVTSVGVGYQVDKETGKETGELCIQFTVRQKVGLESLEAEGLKPLPDFIEDDDGNQIRVQVLERDYKPDVIILDQSSEAVEAEATDFDRERRTRQDPIQPGLSVAHENETAGTLGAIVYDAQTGQPYVLSNWHVFQGGTGKAGDRILQPGPFDGGSRRKSFMGRLVRSHLGLAGDCAVASIEDRSFEESVFEIGVTPSTNIGKAELNDLVIKSGRTTGVTRGIVKRVGVVANIRYDVEGIQQIGGFEIRPDPDQPAPEGEISKGGDSGSVWLIADGENAGTVVGLHFAGESDPDPDEEHALACNIHSVFEKLDITFNRVAASESECALLRRCVDGAAGLPVADPADDDEEPDLSVDNLIEIQQRLFSDPAETLAHFRSVVDEDLTEDQLEKMIEDLRFSLETPQRAERLILAAEALESAAERLPPDFTFPGMDLDRYPIRPGRRKFETLGDALGWILFAGGPFLFPPKKVPFPFHTEAGSGFRYRLAEPGAQSPLEIALFSDWGTGEYQSNYISKQLEDQRFPLGIHCGDIYYAGRKKEFSNFVKKPLASVEGHTQLFFLNANHEMLRGGKWYLKYIDELRSRYPGHQRQEGSYFALESERFQIIGIDTAYFEDGRFQNPTHLAWLEERLRDGRQSSRFNILLSANQPYEYGSLEIAKLFSSDLFDFGRRKLIDLWLWGNTHYCALFNRTEATPFIGSCIGHGGYPYKRKRLGESTPAPLEFLETSARFPRETGLRQGRGNHGFCVLRLHSSGSLGLEYRDWMTNLRANADLSGDSSGRLKLDVVRGF